MATVTIRGLDDSVKAALEAQARRHGRSMEAEARELLAEAVVLEANESEMGLGSRIHARFAAIGGWELELPPRDELPRAADFGT